MSEEVMNLRALGEKTPDCALLRERIGLAAERRMELEVGTATGAAYGEKELGRKAQRNGSRDRDWVDEGQKTVRGTVFPRRAGREGGVAPPEAADGPLFPRLARTKASGWPRRRLAKALTAVLQEAYVQGSSTRSLEDPVKAMGMSGLSKSQVSRLCEDIDGKVKAFLDRPIEHRPIEHRPIEDWPIDGDWPCLWIDAPSLKLRRGGRIVSVAAIIAVGVNTDGRREVLGMEMSTCEAEPTGIAGRQTGDLRRARGHQRCRVQGARRDL